MARYGVGDIVRMYVGGGSPMLVVGSRWIDEYRETYYSVYRDGKVMEVQESWLRRAE